MVNVAEPRLKVKGSRLRLLCPPETGGTRSNATEGGDSHRYSNRLNYTAHRLRRKAQIFSDFN